MHPQRTQRELNRFHQINKRKIDTRPNDAKEGGGARWQFRAAQNYAAMARPERMQPALTLMRS